MITFSKIYLSFIIARVLIKFKNLYIRLNDSPTINTYIHFRETKSSFQFSSNVAWKQRIPVNTFTRPLNLQLPIRQRPNSRQKRGSPLPFAPSIEKMGRYFPRHSSRTPFNVPNVGRLPAETTTVERIYIYILTILSFRRSVAAVCEAGILRSFLLLSLFFGGAPPLQCSTTARAVGPILRLVPGTTGKSYYKLDESREGCDSTNLDFVEMFGTLSNESIPLLYLFIGFSMRFLCGKWSTSVLKAGVDISCEVRKGRRILIRE